MMVYGAGSQMEPVARNSQAHACFRKNGDRLIWTIFIFSVTFLAFVVSLKRRNVTTRDVTIDGKHYTLAYEGQWDKSSQQEWTPEGLYWTVVFFAATGLYLTLMLARHLLVYSGIAFPANQANYDRVCARVNNTSMFFLYYL